MVAAPVDSFQRRINYLRISVTDLCNLRCRYCMPEGVVSKLAHSDILSYEEIVRLSRIAISMGISKIRITGGEPLVRKDVLDLCAMVSGLDGLRSLSMTTNGVYLAKFAQGLFEAGVHRINISLDTLRPDRYAAITGRDCFAEVWKGIETAREVGLDPIKLNVVVMRGVNDDEIEALSRLTFEHPFHVRFIEFMPFREEEQERRFLSSDEILRRLAGVGELLPAASDNSNGPAQHYRYPGAVGKIGIISPISHHFCPTCNRLRLTADGKLRTCLFAADEIDLRGPLRQGASDEVIRGIIRAAIDHKPEKHKLESDHFRKCISRPMVAIGG